MLAALAGMAALGSGPGIEWPAGGWPVTLIVLADRGLLVLLLLAGALAYRAGCMDAEL
jgi:hypothetical protein